MRFVCLVACAALTASSGSALAASCNKGMLWPFVRTAGDCLTDAEIAAGQTGVYSGPTTTNVDVSAIKPDPALQNNNAASSSGGSGGSYLDGFFSGGLLGAGGSLFGGNSAASVGAGGCNKGAFWPFLRDPGDCLTEQEKKEGHAGVYRADEVVAQPSANTAVAGQPTAVSAVSSAPQASASANAAACNKGWLWPFVKSGGDCPTDIQKKDSRTGGEAAVMPVSATATASPQALRAAAPATTPASAAPPVTPASAAAPVACNKGWLWPFVKSAGDCLTDTERQEGLTVTPVNATAAGAPQAAGTAAPAANPTAPPPSAAPACSKGFLWPFVKSAGDCPTDPKKE